MNLTGKVLFLATGSAVLSSVITAVAVQKITDESPAFDKVITENTDPAASAKGYYTVGHSPVTTTDFTKAAESTINGVVSIKSYATPHNRGVYQQGGGFMDDPFFDFFFGSPGGGRSPRRQAPQESKPQQQQLGLGSGVIISQDGYIVTNNHVIDNAERLEVTLNDNRTFDAEVIGTDPMTDLALIKIDAKDLPVIPMGNSENLKVGEWVLAVGNPFGFTSTVTTGIVSAKARSIAGSTQGRGGNMGIESYIQTDAAVNPGNSGGALVNLAGELVGINTAIYSQTGNYAGYSFAVPTTIVKKVVGDIRQFGTVQRAVLGVSIRDLSSEIAKDKKITAVTQGVYVAEVAERSAAREAGIEEGDVITAINGVHTDNVAQLQEQVSKYRPGDTITVTYVRNNKTHKVELKLFNNQGNTTVVKRGEFADLGCAFKKVDAALLKKLGLNGGVQVAGLKDSGAMHDAGVRNGFIINTINDTRVNSADDVEKIYEAVSKNASPDDKVLILRGVYPTGKRGIYAVDLNAE